MVKGALNTADLSLWCLAALTACCFVPHRMAAAGAKMPAPLPMACLSAGCTPLATGPRYGHCLD